MYIVCEYYLPIDGTSTLVCCMDTQTAEKQTQHPTLPPASVLKAAKVLAYYAVWYLDDFLLSEKAGV